MQYAPTETIRDTLMTRDEIIRLTALVILRGLSV